MIRRTIPCYYLDDIGTTEGPLMFVEVSRVSPTQGSFWTRETASVEQGITSSEWFRCLFIYLEEGRRHMSVNGLIWAPPAGTGPVTSEAK